MKKKKLLYGILVGTFIVLVVSILVTFLLVTFVNNRDVIINSSSSELIYDNALIDFETDASISINEDNSITLNLKNLNDFKEKKEFKFMITNIGSKNVHLDKIQVKNIDSNVSINGVKLSYSIIRNDIIFKNEIRQISINVLYEPVVVEGSIVSENFVPRYKANIMFDFKE